MNTDYQKPPLAPKPKILDRLSIKLPSSLMSRPCSSTRGPKPPVAPKPRLQHQLEETCCQDADGCFNRCSNGDLACSEEEIDQENESEVLQAADNTYIMLSTEHLTEEVETCEEEEEQGMLEPPSDGETFCSDDNETQPGQEREQEAESMDPVETDSMDAIDISDADSVTDSVDGVEISDIECTDEVEPEDCDAGEALADADGLSVCGAASDNEGTDHLSETGEESGLTEEENAVEEQAEGGLTGKEQLYNEPNESYYGDHDTDSESAEEDGAPTGGYPECQESCQEAKIPSLGVNNHKPPLLCDEYPYDVIGPPCHTHVPQKAEYEFQPYSVIDSVPADAVCIVDVGAVKDEECSHSKITVPEDEAVTDTEPYYVSSNDVAETKDSQAQPGEEMSHKASESECDGLSPPRGKARISRDSEVDDYADINDSLCEDSDDLQHLEGVSSEDYVEIGDDDETDTEQRTAAKNCESTSKRGHTLLNQLNSQPRFRLCSITVPANLDLCRASELTNRLVFADTTDAFEDDIDFEGHIVPYFEDGEGERDNISDEHVYEEAGLDSEGENFLPLDRKCMVTRSRSLSGKMPGYVPETVPEETGAEYQTHDYCTVALERSGDPLSDDEKLLPSSKPRNFILYPRSYSVEGRDVPMSVHGENNRSPVVEARMKRKDDNLSLPCFISSSGSFSQRGRQPSSGLSTPTSVVDIPPPFELAYITKKPITKSSPSLLVESDSSEKQKKKKSSFKRFLALKFKRKTESKVHVDVNIPSSRSSSESSHHGPLRILDLDRRSMSSSPQLQRGKPQRLSDIPNTFLLYKDGQTRRGVPKAFGNRSVSRVESFEDRSRPPFTPLPLTKPRSISFPNADTSDYENIPAMSSDYENIQLPPRRPARSGTFAEFFDDPNRALSSANETDGYVDMSSFTGFESKPQTPDQESESAYTEPYRACPMAPGPAGEPAGEEDQGRTSEEEDGCVDYSYDRQTDGRSRAFYIAKELVDSEKLHVKGLKVLHEDFRAAVGAAGGEQGEPALGEDQLNEILKQLPEVYQFHCNVLNDLETRLKQWEESQKIADVILSRRAEFAIFTSYISEYDRSMALLEESCRNSPAFSAVVRQFEQQNSAGANISVKHQLLQVIVRVLQYRMLLTDYLNNLSPDSAEYEDTQAALVIVSDVADQANDNLKQGENLLRLIHIEYSIRGHRDVLQPGRVFVKEGTLMKVSRKSRQPRHLFLMNDVMLYTYPQQDGKYRLKNTLCLTGMKVSKPNIEDVQNVLKIEVNDISITLSASSYGEREDWFHTLTRTVADHARGQSTFGSYSNEAREKLWMSLGEKPPTLVPVSHVMMCMNCASDFSLTLRRHHCHACGKIVCRSCSRNKYPLKYLKDRVAKVCDRCYTELKKRGGNMAGAGGNDSPRPNRSSRPLSAVFQNIHPPSLWRHRKSGSALNQVAGSAEGATMSGSLLRCKRSKRNWKKLWFLIKDKVLYTFSGREDKVASESLPLLGFTVKLPEKLEGEDATNVFQLYHKKTLYYTFRAEDRSSALRWVNAIEEATVL
ncbi:FYVE, RhoGEF and PH domain-containing protein 5-like isoform X1 [Megalops cyprinoides]|uniref:FYVE, RhoGEF and PH domain-containing protein 5-like isoform X1 n=1 Tax=Megalops cyprinoides TaxID=118141 RepID=UPI0018651B9E|nr:FYVE, RhoGEF and PH domain-containing protein 5-like isoform X1 [Megalops cyprinoides]